jgi:isopentenyldiphosphate isomerase
MNYPPVVIVDAKDRVVDWKPLPEAWEKGLIHRVVYVIVEGRDGRILLHRRSDAMKLYPGCWDTVCGHVDVTPDYEESAKIELREEAGVLDAVLDEIDYFYTEAPYNNGITPKRFIKIFRTLAEGRLGLVDDYEVTESRWFTLEEIESLPKEQRALGLDIILPHILPTPAPTRNTIDPLTVITS